MFRPALALCLLLPVASLAEPRSYTCTVDGKEWKALADTAVVNTNKLLGRRLGLSLAADVEGAWPRLELTLAWNKLEGKREATVSAQNAVLGADVQAFWQPGVGAKAFYLEKGTVTLKPLDVEAKTATFVLELVLREGNAMQARKNAGNPSHTVTCTLERVPLLLQP